MIYCNNNANGSNYGAELKNKFIAAFHHATQSLIYMKPFTSVARITLT